MLDINGDLSLSLNIRFNVVLFTASTCTDWNSRYNGN